jgi:hypothetical protein
MKEDIMFVKDAVEECLSEDERARNDDKWLIIQVLRKMKFDVFIPYGKLKDMPAFESITRCRRKLQEEGMYLADEKIIEKRDKERNNMTKIEDWFGGKTNETKNKKEVF